MKKSQRIRNSISFISCSKSIFVIIYDKLEIGHPWWPSNQESKKPMQEMQETWVQSLGQEDPLEEGMATHSSIFA